MENNQHDSNKRIREEEVDDNSTHEVTPKKPKVGCDTTNSIFVGR